MSFNNIVSGDPIIASVVMANFRHVNYGSDLLPVDSSGVSVDDTLNLGATNKRWAIGYFNNAYFSGNVGIGAQAVSSLGTSITTLGIRGGTAARTGGIYLDSSDSSVKFIMYGATSDSATLPFAIGTTTNHGIRILINNSAIGAINQSGYFGLGTTAPDTRIHVEGITDATACIKARGSSGATGKMRVQTDGSIFYFEAVSGGGVNFVQDGVSQRATFDSSGNFGIGTSTVSARIHAISTTEQIRWGYDASNYGKTTASSVGLVTFDAAGSGAAFNFAKNVSITGVSASTTPPFKTFTYNVNSSITSYAATEALQLISYQRDGGSPYTKRSAIIANADGTAPSELEIWTKGNGDSSPTNRILVTSTGDVGIGTSTVSARIHAISTTEQIRWGYDASNYGSLTTSSVGLISIGGSLGVVTIANQHKVRAYKSSTQSISHNSSTAVTFDAEDFDTGGLHSTSSNTSRITAVYDGNYIIKATIDFNSDPEPGSYYAIFIKKNGTEVNGTRSSAEIKSGFKTILQTTCIIPLAAGDYIECFAYQNSGSSINIGNTSGHTAIEAIKVS